jgi:GTP cyclohydrolase I
MTTRGVKKPDVSMVTNQFTGEFKKDPSLRDRFYRHIELGR